MKRIQPALAEYIQDWQPSSAPTEKDEAESERVGPRIGAIPGQCYFNARRVVQTLGDYGRAS